MKKLLAVLLVGVALVACSHNEGSSVAPAPEASAPVATPEAPAPEASAPVATPEASAPEASAAQ